MKKSLKKLFKNLLDISTFIELDKLKQNEFDFESTYLKENEQKKIIRERRYLDGKIVFEQSYKRMDDDYSSFELKKHHFDYSQKNTIIEKIYEDNYPDEEYLVRKYDETGNLLKEQLTSNYDQPGYEKLFFYNDENRICKIEFWYYKNKNFEINLNWEENILKFIERIRFKNEGRFSKEYIFLSYNETGLLSKVFLEFMGLTGRIDFIYKNGSLIKRIREYNYSGIKVGKAIHHCIYNQEEGFKKIIEGEYFDNQFYRGAEYFLQEKRIESTIQQNNNKKEHELIVEIKTERRTIKDENDMQQSAKRL